MEKLKGGEVTLGILKLKEKKGYSRIAGDAMRWLFLESVFEEEMDAGVGLFYSPDPVGVRPR